VLFTISVPRKLDCPVLAIEFLSGFLVNLLLGDLQVASVACFNLKST
jgi:hypothetical protein